MRTEYINDNSYYAFGMQMPGRSFNSPNYKYGFNGKEKQDEMHGNSGDMYDFGARIYDPRAGRWLSLDPLQSKYPDLSPYVFVANNPLRFTDPTGKFLLDVHQRIAENALENFSFKINFDKSGKPNSAQNNTSKSLTFMYGIVGQGTRISGGITYPDIHMADNKSAHFDQMNYTQILDNVAKIQSMTSANVNEFKNGQGDVEHLGFEVGTHLHAIQDLYSHSNYVEIYQKTYPENTDITKIPTLREALNDPAYAKFALALQDKENGLKTGTYPGEGPGSHKGMNHDLGAGAQLSSVLFVTEVWGKSVDWFSKAAEAVATKASKEYLNDVKTEVETGAAPQAPAATRQEANAENNANKDK